MSAGDLLIADDRPESADPLATLPGARGQDARVAIDEINYVREGSPRADRR